MLVWFFALLASILLIILTLRRKFTKAYLKSLCILFEIFLALYLAFRLVFPMTAPPAPTGVNKVETDRIYYSYETKDPAMATRGREREIPIYVYHPEKMKIGAQPLFIFSHGAFGVGRSNETLFYELASRGYIVLSLDHPRQAFFSTLSSGKTLFVDKKFFREVVASQGSKDPEGTLESLNRWAAPRIADLNFVLDRLLDGEKDNPYEDKVDPGRIILSGHSLGGGAVLAIGRERPEDIQALVVLEAPFIKDIRGVEGGRYVFVKEDYPRPILHIYSDALWGKMDKITTYALNEDLLQRQDPKFSNKHIEGVGHIGLTDMALVSPILTNALDGGLDKRKAPETLLELNRLVVDFLQEVPVEEGE